MFSPMLRPSLPLNFRIMGPNDSVRLNESSCRYFALTFPAAQISCHMPVSNRGYLLFLIDDYLIYGPNDDPTLRLQLNGMELVPADVL